MINRYKLMMVLILSILFGCTKRETTITSKTDEQFFNEKLEALARSKQPFVVPITELAPFDWDAVCQMPLYMTIPDLINEYKFLKKMGKWENYTLDSNEDVRRGYGHGVFLFVNARTGERWILKDMTEKFISNNSWSYDPVSSTELKAKYIQAQLKKDKKIWSYCFRKEEKPYLNSVQIPDELRTEWSRKKFDRESYLFLTRGE